MKDLVAKISKDLDLTAKEQNIAKYVLLYFLFLLETNNSKEYALDCFRVQKIDDSVFYIKNTLQGDKLVQEVVEKLKELKAIK